ncbi:hypothetical protein LCGC14_2765060 [marine sediment metagenome]|uniref:Uncharacterized protein n=1 Tax=marine sediment metagenome TaxID=412755 RepID=A0A0F9BPE1_9ZZZZ
MRSKPPDERSRENEDRFSRGIDRHFHWKPGHDPNDDDAWEGSGWEYAKVVLEDPKPEGPSIVGTHGPEVGVTCLTKGCGQSLRAIQSHEPREILGYLESVDIVIPKVEDRVVILACPNGCPPVQWRESLLPIRTRLGLG